MITPDQLRAMRSVRGISQAALAHEAGISPASIAEFEVGRRDMRIGTLGKILNVLKVGVVFDLGNSKLTVCPILD